MTVQLPEMQFCRTPDGFPEDWVVPTVGDARAYQRLRDYGGAAIGDEILHAAAEPMETNEAFDLAPRLRTAIRTEWEADEDTVSMALPQLAIGRRGFAALVSGNRAEFFTNPRIISSGDWTSAIDSCISNHGLAVRVDRPGRVELAYENMRGHTVTTKLTGRNAKDVQHEIDHLDGVTALDRGEAPVLWVPAECRTRDGAWRTAFSRFMAAAARSGEEWPYVVPAAQVAAFRSGRLAMEDFSPPRS